jgi:selenide,water dikinase
VERRVRGLLADRGVRVVQEATVREVTATEVTLDDGRTIPSEFTVWTTGAAAPALFRTSSLPCDADGFLAVDETLRATSGVPVWGAGDCISMASAPWMTRSGVYAVRAAPVLAQNLRLACAGAGAGARPRVFVPQRHTLFILDTADGRALFCRRSIAVHAPWALSLKRWIDRRFVLRYAVG